MNEAHLLEGLTARDVARLNQLLSNAASQHVRPPINPTTTNVQTAFVVKAVALRGTVLHDSRYLDSETLEGPLAEVYRRSMAFLNRNLLHVQSGASFNSPSQLEVPPSVFEELLVNALVHRDYLISAPIRLLVFADRVELISPGHLPNHLDVEMVRYGLSNLRNPALASHAFHLLPYQGLGSGIPRATQDWPEIEFMDDRHANQFTVIVRRPREVETVERPASQPESTPQPESQPESRPESTPQPESQPESADLEQRVLSALQEQPASKAELAKRFGQKTVSGQLNKVMRDLLASGTIAYTLPDKPNSRLQKYRLATR